MAQQLQLSAVLLLRTRVLLPAPIWEDRGSQPLQLQSLCSQMHILTERYTLIHIVKNNSVLFFDRV